MRTCGENLPVGLTDNIPRFIRSLSPTVSESLWIAAAWSLYKVATEVVKLMVSDMCQPPSLSLHVMYNLKRNLA